jgi:PAS domain S-box-containing protein
VEDYKKIKDLNIEEEIFRSVFESAGFAVLLLDTEGNLILVNNVFTNMLGYSSTDTLKIKFEDFFYPGDVEKNKKLFTEIVQGTKTSYSLKNRYIKKDGEIFWGSLMVSVVKDAESKPNFAVAFIQDITKERQKEVRLETEQKLFKALMDNISDSIYFKDINSYFIDVNHATAKKLGFEKPDDLVGMNDYDFFAKEHADKAFEDEQKIIKTGTAVEGIVEKEIWPDGKITWGSTTKMPLRDETGRVIGTFGITRDVTEQRNAHLKLKYQAQLLNEINDALFAIDNEYKITSWNKGAAAMYGWKAEEVMGKEISEVLPLNMTNEERMALRRKIIEEENWRGEVIHYCKDGKEIEVDWSISVVKDSEGKQIGSVAIARDITQRKKMEEALKKSEERFRSIYENSTIGIYRSTPEGKIEIANPALIKMLGYNSFEDFSAIDIEKEGYAGENVRPQFKKLLERNGEIQGFENAWKRADGTIIYLRESAKLNRDENGKPISYEGTVEDVTEKRAAEEQIKKFNEELKNLNASKDRFFSIIAHDLRSPFTALLGYSDMIVNDFDEMEDEEIKQFATFINNEAKNVYNLLDNLLTWSRLQRDQIPFQPTNFNLNNTIKKVIELYKETANNKNIELVPETKKQFETFADENMIFTVLRNLTSNAIKFTSDGKISISVKEKENALEICVADSGIGINEEDMQKLFKVGVHHSTAGTSKEKGTGLGLILCKELVEKNDGEIWVTSVVNEGAKFNFTIPLTK